MSRFRPSPSDAALASPFTIIAMRAPSFAAAVLLPLVLAWAPFATAQPTAAPSAPTSQTKVRIADVPEVRDALIKVDIWLEGQRIRYDLPGFSVGVVQDQELIWSKGYGFADLANKIPATDETLYRIASITKTFTATAVMQLVEQGKLSLEDPVVQHLPWFTPKNADPAQPVRVWHLLTHTAGLVREPPGTDWDSVIYSEETAIARSMAETPLSLQPQTRLKYSNYGFSIAGQLVAQLSGKPYTRAVEEGILQPLGMTNSRFLDGSQTCPNLAVPYSRRLGNHGRGIEEQVKGSGLLAAGGLVSNVRDLARWVSFQLNESDDFKGPVLTGRSLREMHQPRFLLPDWTVGWGIG
jgi:D-alanyl-D-alanine carboxypeptidase